MIFRKETSSTTVPVIELDKETNSGDDNEDGNENREENDQSETENETNVSSNCTKYLKIICAQFHFNYSLY